MPFLHHTVTVHKTWPHRTQIFTKRTRRTGWWGPSPSWSSDWSCGRWCCRSPGPCSTGCKRWRWRPGPERSSTTARYWISQRTQHCTCRPGCTGFLGYSAQTDQRDGKKDRLHSLSDFISITKLKQICSKLTICLDSRIERDFLVRGASNVFTVTTSTTALLPYRPETSSPNWEKQTKLHSKVEWKTQDTSSLILIRISSLLSAGHWQEWQQHHGTGVSLGHKACWAPPSQTTPMSKCQGNGPLPGVCVSSANKR